MNAVRPQHVSEGQRQVFGSIGETVLFDSLINPEQRVTGC